jgi:hypothetical protein
MRHAKHGGKMSHLPSFILVVALNLPIVLTPAEAQPAAALKGVPIGAPMTDLLQRFPGSSCTAVPPAFRRLGDQQCTLFGPEASTYGGARVLEMRAFAIAGRFEGFTVALSWRDYEGVRDALRAQHGGGQETAAIAQNTTGARVQSRTWTTTAGGTELMAIENGSPLTQAIVSAASPALQERRRAPAAAGRDL